MNKRNPTPERTNRNRAPRQRILSVAAVAGGLLLIAACQENGSTGPGPNKTASSYVECSQVTVEPGIKRGAYGVTVDLTLVGKVSVQGVAVNFDNDAIHYPHAVVQATEVAGGDAASWDAHYTYGFGDYYDVAATVHATIAGSHQNIACDPQSVEVQPRLP